MAEIYDYDDASELIKYYGTRQSPVASFPVNYLFREHHDPPLTGRKMKQLVNQWMGNVPEGKVNNWEVSTKKYLNLHHLQYIYLKMVLGIILYI